LQPRGKMGTFVNGHHVSYSHNNNINLHSAKRSNSNDRAQHSQSVKVKQISSIKEAVSRMKYNGQKVAKRFGNHFNI